MKICLWCGNDLPKRRRKYCSDECSNQYFVHRIALLWWGNAKRMALKEANNMCAKCGSKKRLEVHHKRKLEPGESRHNSPKNHQENLIVFCRDCHEKEHHPLVYRVRTKNLIPINQGKLDII